MYKRSHPAPKNHEQAKSKVRPMFACPVPNQFCNGTRVNDSDKLTCGKCHGSSREVKACQKRHLLVNLKYVQGESSREFVPSDGGPVLVVSKKAQRSKSGKEGRHHAPRVAT